MIWFYTKEGEHLRCEILQQLEGDHLELVITEPDGTEHVESFASHRALRDRSLELESKLRIQGWDGPFGRDY